MGLIFLWLNKNVKTYFMTSKFIFVTKIFLRKHSSRISYKIKTIQITFYKSE